MNSNIALYRKYRPKDFSEVVGQKNIVNTLKNTIKNNNILHAYIFSGTRGTGKTTIAKIFAKAINCLDLQDGYNPCLKCANCIEIDNNQSTDVIELDAASNNGVDEIRTIVDNVMYLPQRLKKKVYIIDEAHMLSNSAWNALLKTLEEPPSHVVFILATTEFHKIPITIVSRCQRYDFYGLEHDDLSTLIDKVTKQENIKITQEAKDKLIQLSDTAARDCLSILEQLSIYSNNNITLDEINKVFGLVDLNFILRFINLLNKKDVVEFIKYIAVLEKNYDINYFIEQTINCLIDSLIYLKTKDKTLLKILNEDQIKKNELKQEKQILDLLDIFYLILKDIKTKGNPIFYLKYHLFDYLTKANITNKQIKCNSVIKVEHNIEQPIIEIDSMPKESNKQRKLIKRPDNLETINKPIIVEDNIDDEIEASYNNEDEEIDINIPINKPIITEQIETSYNNKDQEINIDTSNNKKNNHETSFEQVLINTKENEIVNKIDSFDVFQRLALNNQKSEVIKLNDQLKRIKSSIDEIAIDEVDKIIQKLDNFYLYSNDVAFIISNSLITVNRFNELFFKDVEFKKQIRKLFDSDKLFIFAITKTEAVKFNNEIKNSTIREIEKVDYEKIKNLFNEVSEADLKKKILKLKTKNK